MAGNSQSVRDRFSLEFVTASTISKTAARNVAALPEISLFDDETLLVQSSAAQASYSDPVEQLLSILRAIN